MAKSFILCFMNSTPLNCTVATKPSHTWRPIPAPRWGVVRAEPMKEPGQNVGGDQVASLGELKK
jgi:hypothetical protein